MFDGFVEPVENWSKLPHTLVAALPLMDTLGEVAVVLYVLRHTWGYQEWEQPKRITLDEFMGGRKRRDGTRLDEGTGLGLNTVRRGLDRAVAHGFLTREPEERDRGRRAFVYGLRMVAVEAGEGDGESMYPNRIGRVSDSDSQGIQNGLPGYPNRIVDQRKNPRKKEAERGDVWPLIETQLRLVMARETFETWFTGARARRDGDVVRIGLVQDAGVAWVHLRLMRVVEAAVRRALDDEEVKVRVGVQDDGG